MSGIAELLLNLGYRISGSDLQESDITRRLESLGGEVHVGHDAAGHGAEYHGGLKNVRCSAGSNLNGG